MSDSKCCIVSGCKNSQSLKNGVTFHNFPKNKEILREWVHILCVNIDVYFKYKNLLVCSEHFTENDFRPKSKGKLLPTAVPSLKLGRDEHSVATGSTKNNPTSSTLSNAPPMSFMDTLKSIRVQASINKEKLDKYYLDEYKTSGTLGEILILILERRICRLSAEQTGLQLTPKEVFKFIDALDIFLREKIHKICDATDSGSSDTLMIAAFRIRMTSKQCHSLLASRLRFPNLCDMTRWLTDVQYTQGILHKYLTVMKILKVQKTVTPCVLQFGYMKTKPLYEYMSEVDVIIGPWKEISFVLVTGLTSDWRQLIYSSFDKKITKVILLDLIMRLYNDSYIVKACVSDYYEDMHFLWNDFDLVLYKPYFTHPGTQEKVFYFVGSTSIIINLRHLLVEHGFCLSNGHKINVGPIMNLLHTNSSSMYDLSLALQLFSHDTILLLQQLGPQYSKVAYPTELFIRNVMNWYKIASSVYGKKIKEEEDSLAEIANMVLKITLDGNAHLNLTKDALIMSITSLKLFRLQMCQEKIITGEMHTKQLSNWELNALFKEIRETGYGYKHVTPLLVFTRLKQIMGRTVCSTADDNCYVIQKFLSIFKPEPQGRDTREIPELLLCDTLISKIPKPDVVNSYVIGWVADKLLDTHPELGTRVTMFFKSSQADLVNISYSIIPSKDWWMNAHLLHKLFESVYHSSLQLKWYFVIKDLLNMSKLFYPHINLEVARSFFKEHLMLYLEYMNRNLDSTANDMDQS